MDDGILLRNQSDEFLDGIYGGRDYYWYLRSDAFKENFLRPLGRQVDDIGGTCVDIGCGEGSLAEFVDGDYLGLDASRSAILKAKERFPDSLFYCCRLEDIRGLPLLRPWPMTSPCKVGPVVLGGILYCLIRPEYYVPLLEEFEAIFKPTHFVLYDLWRLDTTAIAQRFGEPIHISHMACSVAGVEAVKCKRKIEVYQCR